MKNIKFLLSLAVFSLLPVAHAEINPMSTMPLATVRQTPTDESLQKLAEVMDFDKSLSLRLNQNKDMAKEAMIQVFKDKEGLKHLSAEQQRQFEQVIAEFMEKMMNEQNQPELRQQMKNAYLETAKMTYTQEEVNALIAFHSSKVGQSIHSKQGKFTEISNQKMLPIVLTNQQRIMQNLLPEMQQKFNKILKPTQKARN